VHTGLEEGVLPVGRLTDRFAAPVHAGHGDPSEINVSRRVGALQVGMNGMNGMNGTDTIAAFASLDDGTTEASTYGVMRTWRTTT
jgi:hypothetical protein